MRAPLVALSLGLSVLLAPVAAFAQSGADALAREREAMARLQARADEQAAAAARHRLDAREAAERVARPVSAVPEVETPEARARARDLTRLRAEAERRAAEAREAERAAAAASLSPAGQVDAWLYRPR